MAPSMWSSGSVVVATMAFVFWLRRLSLFRNKVSLQDKVVLITGASCGLGEACARAFYCQGAKVILCARREGELERVKKSLMSVKTEQGIRTHVPNILVLDLEKFTVLRRKAQEALSIHGQVDILVNNGGMSYRGQVTDTQLDVDVRLMNVNYFGTVALTKALLPHMIERKSGHIVAVSSVQGKIAVPYRSAYAASKHAMQAFFDCLRAEVSKDNIRVTVVSPGYIKTDLSLNAVTADGSSYGMTDTTTSQGMPPPEVAQQILNAISYKQNELLVAAFSHRIAVYLRNIIPDIFFKLMSSRAEKQKKQFLKQK